MYIVEPISRDTPHLREEFIEFCRKSYESKYNPACSNMWHCEWQAKFETLPYLIYKSDRFTNDNGEFFILRVNGNIEAVSGIYISEFDSNVAIGGVRSWTNPGYQANLVIGRYIFPKQLAWAKAKGTKIIALTFNEYNRRLISYFTRNGLGVVKNRTPDMLFYNGIYEVSHPVMVQHTKQWAIYHKIDEDYEPNWSSIEYKGE